MTRRLLQRIHDAIEVILRVGMKIGIPHRLVAENLSGGCQSADSFLVAAAGGGQKTRGDRPSTGQRRISHHQAVETISSSVASLRPSGKVHHLTGLVQVVEDLPTLTFF